MSEADSRTHDCDSNGTAESKEGDVLYNGGIVCSAAVTLSSACPPSLTYTLAPTLSP